MKRIRKKIQEADSLALDLIESRARNILKEHPNLHEFVMGMGCAFFTDMEKCPTYPKYGNPVFEIITEFDNILHLTGNPMRFTATGDKLTNW